MYILEKCANHKLDIHKVNIPRYPVPEQEVEHE